MAATESSRRRSLGPKARSRAGSATALFSSLLLCAAWPASAAPPPLRAERAEYELKAAYLFHFFGYVKWPEEAFEGPGAPFVLVVVGQDPFGDRLEATLRGRRVGQREIEIRRAPDLGDLPAAHMLFLAQSHSRELNEALKHCAGSSTMVVADEAGLAKHGAVLGFFLSNRHVRFEVNVDAAKRARLSVSSQILKLARVVHDARRDGGPR